MFVVVLVVVGSGHVHAHVLQMCCLCRYPCPTWCCLETVTHDHEHWGAAKARPGFWAELCEQSFWVLHGWGAIPSSTSLCRPSGGKFIAAWQQVKVDNTIQGWVEHDVYSERIAADEDQFCAPRIGCHGLFGQGWCRWLREIFAISWRNFSQRTTEFGKVCRLWWFCLQSKTVSNQKCYFIIIRNDFWHFLTGLWQDMVVKKLWAEAQMDGQAQEILLVVAEQAHLVSPWFQRLASVQP